MSCVDRVGRSPTAKVTDFDRLGLATDAVPRLEADAMASAGRVAIVVTDTTAAHSASRSHYTMWLASVRPMVLTVPVLQPDTQQRSSRSSVP